MEISDADLNDPAVAELVRFHHADMRSKSPREFAFVFNIEELAAPGIHVLTAYDGEELLGIGAVAIRGDEAELKSMRTTPGRLRSGVGAALLEALTQRARENGVGTLFLETGSGPAFESAERFYARYGFVRCGPFGDHAESDFNRFMSKPI